MRTRRHLPTHLLLSATALAAACSGGDSDALTPTATAQIEISVPPTVPDNPGIAGFSEVEARQVDDATTTIAPGTEDKNSKGGPKQSKRRFGPPTNIKAWVRDSETAGNYAVALTWSDPSSQPTPHLYTIYRNEENFGAVEARSFVDSWAEPGKTYIYEVRPSPGQAEIGAKVVVELPAARGGKTYVSRFGAPYDVRAVVDQSLEKVEISWKPPRVGPKPAKYEISRDGKILGSIKTTSYIDVNVKKGKSYTYTVRSLSLDGTQETASNAVETSIVMNAPPATTVDTRPTDAPAIVLMRGAAAPKGYWYAVTLKNYSPDTAVVLECHDSVDRSFFTDVVTVDENGEVSIPKLCYSEEGPGHWVTTKDRQSNTVTWDGAAPESSTSSSTSSTTTTSLTTTSKEPSAGAASITTLGGVGATDGATTSSSSSSTSSTSTSTTSTSQSSTSSSRLTSPSGASTSRPTTTTTTR